MRRLIALLIASLGCLTAAPGALAASPRAVMVNGVEFLHVPAGEFLFGSEADPGHLPDPNQSPFRHVRLWLDDFYIAKYEARASDQLRFMNSGALDPGALSRLAATQAEQADFDSSGDPGCTVRRNGTGEYYLAWPARDLPATNLSWEMAEQFARWLGFRLPTEAEWEKAARGPAGPRLWPWGDEYPDDTFAHFTWSRSCHPLPVNANSKGRSPYGAYNMAGNVAEYVSDWYNYQADQALRHGDRNPRPPATGTPAPYRTPDKITKGGRWSQSPAHLTISSRRRVDLFSATPGEGVRFAIDAERVRELLTQGLAHAIEEQEQ